MTQRRALITGANGFIGSHLTERLVREGFHVRAMKRPSTDPDHGNLALLPPEIGQAIEICYVDMCDADGLQRAVAGMDYVFHLAGVISNPYALQHPDEAIAVNILGSSYLLQAMRQHGIQRGVMVSTSEVYGAVQYVPVDEKHPLRPQSPYAATKASMEALSISWYQAYQLPLVVVRLFNVYGPRQSTRAVIPTIISQALTKSVVSLGALHPMRDYTYVADTAHGLWLAAEREAALGQIINLGRGRSISIGAIAQRIIELIGRPVTIAANEAQRVRSGDLLHMEADNQLALRLLEWQPDVTLDVGLLRTIDWMRDHLTRFDPNHFAI